MKNILYTIFLLGGGFCITSCDEEPCTQCDISADFTMSEGALSLSNQNKWLEADTIGIFYDVKFEAICNDMTRYEWTVGTDQRVFTESSFTLYFASPGIIDVTLVVYQDENTNCPNNTVRVDSVTKQLVIVETENRHIEGKYRGYNVSEPNTIFDVEIVFDSTEAIVGAYVIRNLPEGCHLENSPTSAVTVFPFRTRFYMNFNRNQHSCEIPKGWGELQEDLNEIIIDYQIKDFDTDMLISYQFKGIRI